MSHHETFERHGHAPGNSCRICSCGAPEDEDHTGGICRSCWYKILIIVLIVMIALSYVAWFGIL